MQDAIPHHGCYVIKVHDLKGSSFAVPGGQREKLWQDFFMDPSQWWDHRSEKVSEHQTCQSSCVDGTIALVVVNLVALSWCHMLMQKVSADFSVLIMPFMSGMWRIHG